VRVNDPGADTPEFTTQNETTLAVHDATVCAGYNDTGAGDSPNSISGFARSEDAGITWEDRGVVAPAFHFGDPVLAVHRATGRFYYADLSVDVVGGADGGVTSIIAVSRSTDDCRSFSSPSANASPAAAAPSVCAAPDVNECAPCLRNADCDSVPDAGDGLCAGPDAEDKPWIAVDNSGGFRDGYVYVCWSRFVDTLRGVDTRGEILFSRSADGGLTFANERVLSAPGEVFPIGCFVTVGPGGEVYVAWAERDAGFPIRFRRSDDGGRTWDGAVQVNSMPIRHPGIDRIVTCGETSVCGTTVSVRRPSLKGDVRMASQAWMAVDNSGGPFGGNIYVVWADDPPGPEDNSDVYFSRSTDGGRTWMPEVQIAAGSATDQFEPFAAVGGQGTVTVAWYDRRNDAANNRLIDVYATFSRDGGESFEPITRLTDVSFRPPPISGQPTPTGNFDPRASACYMGEYIAATADSDFFYYAWGDNRGTVTSAAYPLGRADPDVFFERRPVPPIAFCTGDCDGNGEVTVDELLIMVNIALGAAPITDCLMGDVRKDSQITVDEIVAAVRHALQGCPGL
jgi:hypothetical protein